MSATSQLRTIEKFLETVKSAEAFTEPTSKGGPTTHPSKDAPDDSEPGKEGARGAENTADVKKEVGPASVDATPEAEADKAAAGDSAGAEDQLQIGVKKGPTGTDVPAVRATAKDPGSTHPARTDNDELNGGKYAGDAQTMSLTKLAEAVGELGTDLCALMTINASDAAKDPFFKERMDADKKRDKAEGKDKNQHEGMCPGCNKPSAECTCSKEASVDPRVAQHAGWGLADIVSGRFDKKAADAMVHTAIVDMIKVAETDADNVAKYLHSYAATQQKIADSGGDGPSAGDAPPSGLDPSDAGGDPGDPGGAGGDPGDPSGGGGSDEAQLMAILQQMGITPEELIEMLQSGPQGAGGAGGPPPGMPPPGMPPPGAGGPPPGAGGPPPGMQVSAADESAKLAAALNTIKEITARSRAKAAAAAA